MGSDRHPDDRRRLFDIPPFATVIADPRGEDVHTINAENLTALAKYRV